MNTVTGYIRLANEEDTIISCLNSINNVFDKILIIHSNITDSSLELINEYIKNNNITNTKIHKYPYDVIPPHSIEYTTNNYNYENSLAAYYNFGLQFIDTDFVMKIDADQIYIQPLLKTFVDKSLNNTQHEIFGTKGHNCVVSKGHIYELKNQPQNGGQDHFLIPVKYAHFEQKKYWELLVLQNTNQSFYIPKNNFWFHIKDGHRYNNKFVSGDKYNPNDLQCFNQELIDAYEKYVLPLLEINESKFKNLKYKC